VADKVWSDGKWVEQTEPPMVMTEARWALLIDSVGFVVMCARTMTDSICTRSYQGQGLDVNYSRLLERLLEESLGRERGGH
jgi:hypothetical protein